MIAARALLVLALSIALAACSGAESSAPSASLEADVEQLQELLGTDPARTVLREIEDAIDSERPVMAADLIERAGAPSVRRQIERFQQARMATQEGRRFQARGARVHRARLQALEAYGALLARGVGTEDEALLEAMHAYADAEIAIVALHDDLARIRPLAPGAAERADREARLGGLPPLRREGDAQDEEGALPEEGPDPSSGEPAEPLPE